MTELSVTITAGEGSERHNHDIEYRETLQHVHSRPDGVIEFIPYEDYKTQINAALKPYIDEYNAKVDARYHAAWERYNNGQIKTKPRRRDYKHMDYDYYTEHLNDECYNPAIKKNEKMPMWRSLIIGIGDQEDRKQGKITEEEAKAIFGRIVERFKENFPNFLLLGMSLHLDEQGFYHVHLDYKPLYKKECTERGLSVGTGFESALEQLGFKPEQSIVNGRDKVPILFNAFRNKLYYILEEEMAVEGLRLQYGVSKVKEPGKDSSRNQKLEDWQETQDRTRELQHQKNVTLNIIEADQVSPEGYKAALKAVSDIENVLTEIDNQKRSRFKNEVVVHFSLFDQLRSFIKNLMNTLSYLLQKVDILRDNLNFEIDKNEKLKDEVARLKPFEKYDTFDYKEQQAELRRKAQGYDAAIKENAELKKQLGIKSNEFFDGHH